MCFFSTDWLFAIRKPSETVSSGDKHPSPQVTEICFSSVDTVIAAAIHPSAILVLVRFALNPCALGEIE